MGSLDPRQPAPYESNGVLFPKYKVTQIVKRNAHLYEAEYPPIEGLEPRTATYKSVTHYLEIISKPQLVQWAKKVSFAKCREALLDRYKDPEVMYHVTPEDIDSIIEQAKKRPDEVKDEAALFGTRVHAIADRIIKTGMPGEIPEELEFAVKGFYEWLEGTGIKILMGDTSVASHLYEYGGAFDAIGIRDGKYGVIDFKTSNALRTEYDLQGAAYCKAAEATYGVPFEWVDIVRINKTAPLPDEPGFEVRTFSDIDHAFRAFLAAKNLKDLLKERG
jgi:hypothetical protein